MLLGDGSPTRHLRLLTGSPVAVDLIAMEADQTDHPGAPEEVKELMAPLLRRQVWLTCGGTPLAWAESWWNQAEADWHLRDRNQPIWKSLTEGRSELFREVDGLALVEGDWLVQTFEVYVAALREEETLSGNQLAHDIGDENLTSRSFPCHAGSGDDGSTEEVVVLSDWFTSVYAYAKVDGLPVTFGERLLQQGSALQCPLGRPKPGHETVSQCLHLRTPVAGKGGARDFLVFTENCATRRVAEALHHLCVALDISEEDRSKLGFRFPPHRAVIQKLQDELTVAPKQPAKRQAINHRQSAARDTGCKTRGVVVRNEWVRAGS